VGTTATTTGQRLNPQVHGGRLPAPQQAQDRVPSNRAGQLRGDVPGEVVRMDFAPSEEGQGDDRVEVRTAAPAQRADRQQVAVPATATR